MASTSLIAALVLATIASSAPAPGNDTSGSITFESCGSQTPPTWSCAGFQVPINWDDPNGDKITIDIIRVAATNPSERIGHLFWQPGGPGLDPTLLLEGFAFANISMFPEEFDIIAPIPRGVGTSHPLQCDPSLFNARQKLSLQPTTQAEFNELVKATTAYGESCRNLTGPLVDYLDSASVAKDFEAIRLALGGEPITYLGMSYGTVVGQIYAALFPDSIRAMALDGNLDHSLSQSSALTGESNTYENVFDIFAQYCQTTSSCPLYGQNVTATFTNLVNTANENPVPAPGCNPSTCLPEVSGTQILFNLQALLVFEEQTLLLPGWDTAGLAIKQATEGNATLLSSFSANTTDSSNIWGSGIGTLCQDWNRSSTFPEVTYKQQMTLDFLAPITRGASEAWVDQVGCIGWPAAVTNQGEVLNIQNSGSVFLTNAYHDTETSYVWAVGLLSQFAGDAVLASRNGDGHTSWFLGPSSETHNAINNFLATAELPPKNTVYQT